MMPPLTSRLISYGNGGSDTPASVSGSTRDLMWSSLCGGDSWVGSHDHRVGDPNDLVGRQLCAQGVLGDRPRAACLIDTHSAQAIVGFVEDVTADPTNVLRHLLVAHFCREGGCGSEILRGAPGAAPQDDVRVHDVLQPCTGNSG